MVNNDVKPNEVTYTTMLSMWGASKHPKARANVMRIFKEMTDSRIGLDLVGYSSLLTAISRSRDENAPYRADEVFAQMTANRIQPDVVAYSILLTIWSRSWVRGKEKKVHEIYQKMLADGIQPSTQTYTTLLNCWANCKHSQAKARINEIYDRLYQEVIDLDGRAYEALLMALKRASTQPLPKSSTDESKGNSNGNGSGNGLVPLPKEADYVSRAEALLLRSLDFGLQPSMQCWAKVIAADAASYPAYPRALRLYSTQLRDGVAPDAEVVSAVLVVLAYASKYESKAVEVASAIMFKYVEPTPASTTGREVSIPLFNMYLNVIVNANADLDLKLKLAVVAAERLWPAHIQMNRSNDMKGEDELVYRNTRSLYQSLLDEYKLIATKGAEASSNSLVVAASGDADSYVERIVSFIDDTSRFIERNSFVDS